MVPVPSNMAKKTYLYVDRFSGDEMFSGAHRATLVDDVAFEVASRMVPKDEDAEVDVGAGGHFGDGGEADGGAGAGGAGGSDVEMVNNVVLAASLQPIRHTKASLTAYFKGYMKRVREALKESGRGDRVRPFMEGMKVFLPKVVGAAESFDFYTGESMDADAGLAMLRWHDDGVTQSLFFLRDGLALVFPGNGKTVTGSAVVPREVAEREGFVYP